MHVKGRFRRWEDVRFVFFITSAKLLCAGRHMKVIDGIKRGFLTEGGGGGGGGCTHTMNGRSRMTIVPCSSTMPGRNKGGRLKVWFVRGGILGDENDKVSLFFYEVSAVVRGVGVLTLSIVERRAFT